LTTLSLQDGDLLVLRGEEVATILENQEQAVMDAVSLAYQLHTAGKSSLPHSTFLRFPDNEINRIISLPAYLGGDLQLAGMKWVASFPGNLDQGMDRASALLALNSATTGRPVAMMEASIISARRTAASAALAGQKLMAGQEVKRVGFVGCGLINFEIARFLVKAAIPSIETLVILDIDPQRGRAFGEKCEQAFGVEAEVVSDLDELFGGVTLTSFATNTGTPHVDSISACAPGSAILHVSLRDLTPRVILEADNVVDDLDHVARARTSIHLAELEAGHRDFVRCNLGEILLSQAPARRDARSVAIFSPFGLGVLDLAVAHVVQEQALANGIGTVIPSFLPPRWTERG
jgi:ornithine cyclodeaminase